MADNIGHTEIDTVLIKVASRCNVNCSYCYVYNMGDDNYTRMTKLMSDETLQATCRSLISLINCQTKPFSIILHGGEPFLLGVERLRQLLSMIRHSIPFEYPISIQTNGILISDDLLDICSIYRASIAVSIDGPKAVHDKFRVGHNGKGTFDDVMAGIKLLSAHKDSLFLNAGVLAVVDPESDPAEVYYFFKSLGAPSVDFLYKDGNHDKLPLGKSGFGSLEYGQWMTALLSVYLNDTTPLPIRIVDDMLKVLLGGIVSKEGLGLTDFGIIIIDTDGTVMKNDTLKSSYNGADKFDHSINVKGDLIAFINSPAFSDYRRMQRPTNPQCLSCPELNICGGGMLLHRWSKTHGFDNVSVYCSDQLYLISEMRKTLAQITQYK